MSNPSKPKLKRWVVIKQCVDDEVICTDEFPLHEWSDKNVEEAEEREMKRFLVETLTPLCLGKPTGTVASILISDVENA